MMGLGIAFTTRGWEGAELLVQHGLGNATFAVAGDEANAYAVAVELLNWLGDEARPWTGELSSIRLDILDADNGRLVFVYVCEGTTLDLSVGSSTWRERIAVSTVSATVGVYGTSRGTCSALAGLVGLEPLDTEPGARCRRGAWRVGHPRLAHRRPTCEFGLDLDQVFAFSECIQLEASQRTAWIFDEVSEEWFFFYVGEHRLEAHREDDVTCVFATLDLLGVP